MSEPTILVVGAGTFGTSTAYHLAQQYKDPSKVTIIDRWNETGTKQAAAVDINRIIRTDYADPLYCNLANEAIHPWRWSLELGHFFHHVGWMCLDAEDSEFAKHVRNTFRKRGSDYIQEMPSRDLVDKYEVLRGMKLEGLEKTCFNPEAGWCDAENATANFMAAAQERGVRRMTGDAKELIFDAGGGRVTGVATTDGRRITADRVVLATGAWTSKLLSPIEDALRISAQDRIERQVQAIGRLTVYYHLSQEETNQMAGSGLPVLVFGEDAVLMPPSKDNRTLKINDLKTEFVNTITTESGNTITVPSTRNQLDVPRKLKLETEGLVASLLPEFARRHKPNRWRICWDAKTPTEDWLMCKHPHARLGNLYLAVGGSFHSYKFMPIAGKYMCNVLQGKSNGEEKDKAWGWKVGEFESRRKELGSKPRDAIKRELGEFLDVERESRL